MSLLVHVDAFTNERFKGNPAAVYLMDEPESGEFMQNLAVEMNLSETAFLLKKGGKFSLRWFTPTVEIALCGHATLATAHVLWEKGLVDRDAAIEFQTKSGILRSSVKEDGWMELDFPIDPPKKAEVPKDILKAYGIDPKNFLDSAKAQFGYVVELADLKAVQAVRPNFAEIEKVGNPDLIVTAKGGGQIDFCSRVFVPQHGIPEDPVTGSAHCVLTPYWAAKLPPKKLYTAYQASKRGGYLRVRSNGDRVFMQGQAVTVYEANLPRN